MIVVRYFFLLLLNKIHTPFCHFCMYEYFKSSNIASLCWFVCARYPLLLLCRSQSSAEWAGMERRRGGKLVQPPPPPSAAAAASSPHCVASIKAMTVWLTWLNVPTLPRRFKWSATHSISHNDVQNNSFGGCKKKILHIAKAELPAKAMLLFFWGTTSHKIILFVISGQKMSSLSTYNQKQRSQTNGAMELFSYSTY